METDNRTTIAALSDRYRGILAPEDFFVLLAHAIGRPKEFLFAHPEHLLTGEELARALGYFTRRSASEPVAYITGHREFYGRDFRVTPDTLIPRPETELLIERTLGELSTIPAGGNGILIDIGTGSGAIIVSLAAETRKPEPVIALHAIDISREALAVASENAKRHDVADRISFHHGHLLDPVAKLLDTYETAIVVANLPYLSETIYASASKDVRAYEPKIALLADEDGLALYRETLEMIARHKGTSEKPKHFIGLLEISPEQDARITEIFSDIFPEAHDRSVISDLSGRPRIFRFTLD